MSYQTIEEILPKQLISEIQKYIDGASIYIPAKEKTSWGAKNGTRQALSKRNEEIRAAYQSGIQIAALAEHYFLAESTIRHIIYRKTGS
ncbi:CD3324 family protein [Listeria costaricensis]|uniref:CD3324 family protein n=1 Tax=Listeria costaricensis TaxID=2026604 RepID=UPI000C08A3B7|nr:CD3324 family protein [Listeria costaricensis]